jgi:hypothetical protein
MEELFRPVLHTSQIDESWQPERQMQVFFENDDDYLAVTHNNKFRALVSRMAFYNAMIKTLVDKR